MSRWTHVAGIIRIDSLPIGDSDETHWVSPLRSRLARCVPEGSEGPLHFKVVSTTPAEDDGSYEAHCISRGYVAIWGDLRDFGEYSDMDRLREWLVSALDGFAVRQGILEAEDERAVNTMRLTYDCAGDHTRWVWTIGQGAPRVQAV